MKVLIVDDEKPARDRLTRLLDGIDGYSVVATASNGIEAIQHFNGYLPDIILMDIRMPVMDGIEATQHLMALEEPPAIIFVTAYEDHALQAFEAHAVDYLLKPIRSERLEAALEASRHTTRAQQTAQLETITENEPGDGVRTHICVKKRGNLELVPIGEIYYFFAEHKYVTLRSSEGESLIEESLVNLEKEFAGQFLRVHRNALVSEDKINGLVKQTDGSHAVSFRDIENIVEVSRRHLPNIRRILKK